MPPDGGGDEIRYRQHQKCVEQLTDVKTECPRRHNIGNMSERSTHVYYYYTTAWHFLQGLGLFGFLGWRAAAELAIDFLVQF